jgi:hypothetical protein
MKLYNYNLSSTLTDARSKVSTKVEVDTKENYGYFERWRSFEKHDEWISEGGLWFERVDGKLNLMDYDGVYELAPAVIKILRGFGITVEEIFESDIAWNT